MSADAREVQVRSFLERMAEDAPVPSPASAGLLRRARRRAIVRVAAVAATCAVIAAGGTFGIAALGDAPTRVAREHRVPVVLEVSVRIPVERGPETVAAVGDAIWVANPTSLSRIDPVTATVVDRVVVFEDSNRWGAVPGCYRGNGNYAGCPAPPSTDRVLRLAGGGGAVWATTTDLGGSVLRVDGMSGDVTGRTRVAGAYDLTYGQGAVWVAGSEQGTGVIARLDPSTGARIGSVALEDHVEAVAVGDGSVWTALGGGGVARIDPTTMEVVATFDTGLKGLRDITVADGIVWVASDRGLSRVDADDGSVTTVVVDNPQELVGGGGGVWVSAYDTDELLELDARTGEVIGRVTIGGGPNGKVFAAGALWIALDGESEVARVEPAG